MITGLQTLHLVQVDIVSFGHHNGNLQVMSSASLRPKQTAKQDRLSLLCTTNIPPSVLTTVGAPPTFPFLTALTTVHISLLIVGAPATFPLLTVLTTVGAPATFHLLTEGAPHTF